jgi:hypothetical protein
MLPRQTSPGAEVLDLLPAPGGEAVDDDDVVVLCQGIRKVRAKPAPPVAMERMKRLWRWGRLGVSEWCRGLTASTKSYHYSFT